MERKPSSPISSVVYNFAEYDLHEKRKILLLARFFAFSNTQVISSHMNWNALLWEAWLPFIRGSCCALIITDMTSKLKVELGIWETGDWLAQPQELSDNWIWLLQQTQRRQGVEWEDNRRRHQGISGSSATLSTQCFARLCITHKNTHTINSQSYYK